jgi:hypothetical protein
MKEKIKKLNAVVPVTYAPLQGVGKIGEIQAAQGPLLLAKILSTVIGVLSISGIIFFIFQLIFAGYDWIAAAGDSQKIQAAQKKLYSSLLGIFVVLIAVAFISLVGFLFGGIDFLNLQEIINKLKP